MRRQTKRVFRYVFPFALIFLCIFLFHAKSQKKDAFEKDNFIQDNVVVESPASAEAKVPSLIAHNPQTKTKLQIDAADAIQEKEGQLLLNKPTGLFQNARGLTALLSKEARYSEEQRTVKFFDDVSFKHYSGLIATTDYAAVDTSSQDISGDHGVKAKHMESTITANAFEVQHSNNLIKFNGSVSLNVSRKVIAKN